MIPQPSIAWKISLRRASVRLGFSIERLPGRDGYGDVLLCRRPGRSNGPGILMIAHADTVDPVGTRGEQPAV